MQLCLLYCRNSIAFGMTPSLGTCAKFLAYYHETQINTTTLASLTSKRLRFLLKTLSLLPPLHDFCFWEPQYLLVHIAARRSTVSGTTSQVFTRHTAELSERSGRQREIGVKFPLTLVVPVIITMAAGDRAMLPRWAAQLPRTRRRRRFILDGADLCRDCRSGGWTSTTLTR